MKTILIVDDDMHIQETLSEVIAKNTGYRTIFAKDGEAALDVIQTETPDLIMIDMLMPRIGGIALYHDIRHFEKTKNTPVIFMSGAMTDETFIREGLEMGAAGYIRKPVDATELLDTINAIISEK